jgi:hypothetical protein
MTLLINRNNVPLNASFPIPYVLIGRLILLQNRLRSPRFVMVSKEDYCGLWLFEEGAGKKIADSSDNKNDGEIIGELKWVEGKYGKALEFPGASQNLVQVPDSKTLNPTKGITVMAWGWLVDAAGGNRRFLQKSTPGSDNQYRFLLEWGVFKFDAGPGVSPEEVTTGIFSENEWHHVAGVYDGKEIALYIDGEKVAKLAASGEMIPSTGPLSLGAKWNDPGDPGDYWKGKIDELAVFNRGLTADEIKEAMKGLGNLSVEPAGKLATTWASIKAQ